MCSSSKNKKMWRALHCLKAQSNGCPQNPISLETSSAFRFGENWLTQQPAALE